jgi:hypothetical protein
MAVNNTRINTGKQRAKFIVCRLVNCLVVACMIFFLGGKFLQQFMDEAQLKYRFNDVVVVAHSMGGLINEQMIQ